MVVAVPRLMESLKDELERDMEQAGRVERFRAQLAAAKHQHFARRWLRFRRIHSQFGWKFWAFISGGAALDAETEEFWRRLGFVVIQGYGLTETTSLISLNHPFRTGERSIGKVMEGREIKLDENGEILVRGANIAAGYWQGDQLRPVLDAEGWFHTGDLGELDAEGNLYFKGRQKNVIVTREGMNVHPEDLEAALRHQPGVRDCVVVGLEQGGNAEPVAVLILDDAGDAEAAVQNANQHLAEFQRMRRSVVWPEEDFPRTPTHKPKTAAIQQEVQRRFGGDGTTAAVPQGAMAELIARITGRNPGALAPNARLEDDLNLSSMDRVELMSALEDRYQVDLGEANFTKVRTVGELEKMIQHPQRATQGGYRYPRWTQRWPIRWIRDAVYYLLTWPATLLMAHPTIIGAENLRDLKGPVLVTCNHVTYIDLGFVLKALPPRLRSRLAVGMWGEMLWEMWRPPASWNFFRRMWWAARIGPAGPVLGRRPCTRPHREVRRCAGSRTTRLMSPYNGPDIWSYSSANALSSPLATLQRSPSRSRSVPAGRPGPAPAGRMSCASIAVIRRAGTIGLVSCHAGGLVAGKGNNIRFSAHAAAAIIRQQSR